MSCEPSTSAATEPAKSTSLLTSSSKTPRNIYKEKRPDFAYLASKYERFAEKCTMDATGRVKLDFQV